MKINKNTTIKLRIFLISLIALSLGLFSFNISYLFINKVPDIVMSMIALVVLSLFALMEITITLVNFKKPLGVEKIGFTERDNVNPIPLIATGLIAVIGLAFIIPGLIFFFSKDDVTVKSYALVLLSMGTFILLNCIFYLVSFLTFRVIKHKNL